MNKDILRLFQLNNCVDKDVFPNELKHADVTPIHAKKDKSDKTSYRPTNIFLAYAIKLAKKQDALCQVTGFMSCNENVFRITIQLLSFNMDGTFQNFER